MRIMILLFAVPILISALMSLPKTRPSPTPPLPTITPLPTLPVQTPEVIKRSFRDDFSQDITIYETASATGSSNSDWWINSGGMFIIKGGIASTNIGETSDDHWKQLYASSNPADTDNGSHPQNIFRLVTKSKWLNYSQQVYFKVVHSNLSDSPQRNESNGVHLFNRYQDGEDIYYAGVRVDGKAVIKKKIGGEYFTMASKQYFPGVYDKTNNPNLLPGNEWIGLRADVTNLGTNAVKIELYLDRQNNGQWEKVVEAIDENGKYSGEVLTLSGYTGIRTDFLDVQFDNYSIQEF